MDVIIGTLLGLLAVCGTVTAKSYILPSFDWQCTASHREGPEHDQHDVCDQYSRKEK